MKTRRQQRYAVLRSAGFLRFEARPLSRVPIRTVPYMTGLIRERKELYRDAKRQKATIARYEAEIKALYRANKFTKTDWRGKDAGDPWAFLRDYEERYRAKYPAYESPWEKRRRTWKDFLVRIERQIDEQRHGGRRKYLEAE